MPTGRLIVGRGAPAQANSQRNHVFFRVVNLDRRLDLGLVCLTPHALVEFGMILKVTHIFYFQTVTFHKPKPEPGGAGAAKPELEL